MAYQSQLTPFSSPSSDQVDGYNATGSSPVTTGFASAGSQSHYRGALAAHYSRTHGVTHGVSAPVMSSPATAAEKEGQRQRIIDHVNTFLQRYDIGKVVTDVQQCTSSLFVLLYQRFFNCTIQGIERSPNTSEKKRRNVQLVLEELEKQGYSVSTVEADEVVRLNEDHISRLVMVFVQIAEDMRVQETLGYGGSAGQMNAPLLSGGYAPYSGDTGLGYTVAEVARRPGGPFGDTTGSAVAGAEHAHHAYHHHTGLSSSADVDADGRAGLGAMVDEHGYVYEGHRAHESGAVYNGHTHHHVSQPRAGAATGSFHDDDDGAGLDEEEDENRSGMGSYMVDLSVMPTDKLLEEWYRDLETPALGEGSLNLSYPTTELRSSLDSQHGASPDEKPHHRERSRAYTDALNTADIRQRHRLLNETLDRLDARRVAQAPHPNTNTNTSGAAAGNAPAGTTTSTTPLSSYHSGIGSQRAGGRIPTARQRSSPQPQPKGPPAVAGAAPRHRPANIPLEEPPLTRAETRLLASHPYRQIDSDYRDRKIERLRAARFLANSQDLIRQRMRRQYDEAMHDMRHTMKNTLTTSKRERLDRMHQIRDENERYRRAYEVLMESAANDVRVPSYMMSRHTAELAEYFASSLHESRRMCEYLEAERTRRNREDVMQYAESVTAWQRQAYV